jgi:lysyl-tRNA synthetase class 2
MASISWRPASTHISQVDFDDQTDTLTVEFVDGRTYDYMNVPPSVARDFQNAGSAGQYLNRHIKGRYAAEEQ